MRTKYLAASLVVVFLVVIAVATSSNKNRPFTFDLMTNPAAMVCINSGGQHGYTTCAKRSEAYSGVTNGSGVYTVTFTTAYAVAPNIQVNPISNTSNVFTKTSVTTTGFTVTVYSYVTNNLLGIISLTSTVTNLTGVNVDVLCTEK